MMKNKSALRALLFRAVGLIFSVAPVLTATLLYFPLWQKESAAKALSGGVLLLILFSILPIFKLLKRIMKSPSVYMLWLICFLLFFSLAKIAEEMTVISFVGFIGNLIGAFFFKLGEGYGGKNGDEG